MDAFAAIADPVRRSLLERLASGPARVVDLAAEHPISRPAISKHLRLLVEAGLVAADQHGRERHYRLVRAGLAPVRSWTDALVRTAPPIPASALDGLDLEVRRTSRDRRGTPTPRTHEETA
ncbi:metalloregulator ArsR/SmtB family transcription factor [Nocardioides sp. LHD-245]|uniref:ArsR/SmtB family transcription factor n=1 Tax=Nocardioides sp. LHD-245 TaxID=3051387 RepID=UPI0027DFBEB0|nr:metalloregulator ArsR/SmtB family transcription factor [Nocardioides sp. LHD-245]